MVSVPLKDDLRRAARSIRRIVENTAGLPGDSPRDAQLRERLDLAAHVLDAAADESGPSDSSGVKRSRE